ncbi:hypothetical protein HK098_003470 [Nowakowskiella sp. JEL0407]|nr:hypothetical protein HK098_003470 [Nowakowskiella sp. JEL0407]
MSAAIAGFYSNVFSSPANIQRIYDIAVTPALPCWILLAIAPSWFVTRTLVKAAVLVNCAAYAFLVCGSILFPGEGETALTFAAMGSFPAILKLFRAIPDQTLLACWLHYIAFDLVCGQVIALDAQRAGIPRIFVVPFLFSCLMLGPAGFGLYAVVRMFIGRHSFLL